ncbi:MAG TPA: hypothetical protein VM390_02190, partial [Acidimicrobiales bacterium]|nr:hypothetical protein [Acidimicrobiales bacterium]
MFDERHALAQVVAVGVLFEDGGLGAAQPRAAGGVSSPSGAGASGPAARSAPAGGARLSRPETAIFKEDADGDDLGERMSLVEHLTELRRRVIVS